MGVARGGGHILSVSEALIQALSRPPTLTSYHFSPDEPEMESTISTFVPSCSRNASSACVRASRGVVDSCADGGRIMAYLLSVTRLAAANDIIIVSAQSMNIIMPPKKLSFFIKMTEESM